MGDFASLAASDLGAVAIKAAVERAGIKPADVQEVIMGNVLPAGQGQAPARQASLKAGLPLVDRLHDGQQDVRLGDEGGDARARPHRRRARTTIMVAGGMEIMTNAPYLLPKARAGYRMGHQTVVDHMFLDGLEDAYDKGRLMGTFAEDCAANVRVHARGAGRVRADVARRARSPRTTTARSRGRSRRSPSPGSKGDVVIDNDEQPAKASPDKIPTLKPAFRKDGTVTAANSSSISDGAAALVLMRRSTAEKRGLEAARGHRRARDARAGAGAVHDGAGRRDREALREDRLDDEGRRPLRDQRGVRRGDDGGDEGARHRRTTRSTCTAARARSAIRSAPPARASSSR